MVAYILGAGASKHAGYPLASELLQCLSDWLDRCDESEPWVVQSRNRIVQVRETFGSLNDFEGILGKLEEYGTRRVHPPSPTTYSQDVKDIFHDCTEVFSGNHLDTATPAQGFYPQYLRSDLISAVREYFFQTELNRSGPTGYDVLGNQRMDGNSTVITFNYDVALERALANAGTWDIGTGYGFRAFSTPRSSTANIFKLHGSVNWFQAPMQQDPPPLMFERDLRLLGYSDLRDARIGQRGTSVNNSGTLILPDPRKRFFWEEFWRPLWEGSAECLRAADEVFIHGYSMPSADSRARQLLFGNINRSAAVNIYCLGTSDSIAEEFRQRSFRTVRAFPKIGFETWVAT